MQINRRAKRVTMTDAVTRLRENCLGCADCNGACHALTELWLLPEIVTDRLEKHR